VGRFVLAFAVVAALGAAAPGRAGAVVSPRATTVLIIRPPNGPPAIVEMLVRLKGELSSAGFGSEIVEGPAEPLAARRGVAAVVAIIGDTVPDSVEISVMDDGTGKALVRRVRLDPAAPRSAHTLAIRAIELLRSSLLEIELARAAADGENAPGAPLATSVPPTIRTGGPDEAQRRWPHPGRFAVELGGAALVSPNGVGPTLLPLVRFGWPLRPWLFGQAALAGLGTRTKVDGRAGSAHVSQAYALLGGSMRWRGGSRWQPFASVSAGALHTAVEGQADAPNQGRVASQWSFLVEISAGTVARLSDRWYLSLAANAQLAEPYVAVRFVGEEIATAGRPNLGLTLTVGAWL
jgi:hypothetical protein